MSGFNDWFCSLPEGRQAVLRDDKWRLADSAFQAGFKQAQAEIDALKAQNAELISSFSEVLRISDRQHDAWDAAKKAIAKARGE